MKIIPWITAEVRFVRMNAQKGIAYLIANIDSVAGNKRTDKAIQRIAHIYGISIKRYRKKAVRAPRKETLALRNPDDLAQENVRQIQSIAWPV